MSRLNVITPERMSPEQRKVYEESVAAGTPTGTTGGPYTAYIRNPEYMRLHREVANYLRRNSLPGRLRQMLVLRTIKHWGAKYPWVVQVRASLREGLEQSIIDAIDKGQNPALTSPQGIARCVADLFGFQLTGGRWNCSGKPEWYRGYDRLLYHNVTYRERFRHRSAERPRARIGRDSLKAAKNGCGVALCARHYQTTTKPHPS